MPDCASIISLQPEFQKTCRRKIKSSDALTSEPLKIMYVGASELMRVRRFDQVTEGVRQWAVHISSWLGRHSRHAESCAKCAVSDVAAAEAPERRAQLKISQSLDDDVLVLPAV